MISIIFILIKGRYELSLSCLNNTILSLTLALCKDKAAWCKFVDCSIPEAATLCPSACNTCGKKEPEVTPETIEGDIIGRIVKNDDDHLLPNKVHIRNAA